MICWIGEIWELYVFFVSFLRVDYFNRFILLYFTILSQYYREARVKALKAVYPDYVDEICNDSMQNASNYKIPRPLSAPPSPTSSRHTTPHGSRHGSDDEDDDSVDEELELKELGLRDSQ